MKLKVKKLVGKAKMPSYAHPGEDACFDISIVIDGSNKPKSWHPVFKEYREIEPFCRKGVFVIEINPGESVVFRTGLAFEIEKGYSMKVYPRSSTGIKRGLVLTNGTAVIDAGYRDELFIALRNEGTAPYVISDGDRLVQAEICRIEEVEFVEADELSSSERGLGGIGSSGM